MVELWIIAEGATEEQFIKRMVAPALRENKIYAKPFQMQTSAGFVGGAITFSRLKRNIQNKLKENANFRVSTLIDFYALDHTFPNFEESKKINGVYERVAFLETALLQSFEAGDGHRLIPYIQPYEFESLLFSDAYCMSLIEPDWKNSISTLIDDTRKFENPELINGGAETHPAKRLESHLRPRYRKARHGPLIAEKISLPKIESKCPHFRQWMNTLRSLTTY